jgi:hypothetical protein
MLLVRILLIAGALRSGQFVRNKKKNRHEHKSPLHYKTQLYVRSHKTKTREMEKSFGHNIQ